MPFKCQKHKQKSCFCRNACFRNPCLGIDSFEMPANTGLTIIRKGICKNHLCHFLIVSCLLCGTFVSALFLLCRLRGSGTECPLAVYVQYVLGHLSTCEEEQKVIGWIIRAAVELNKGGEMREV